MNSWPDTGAGRTRPLGFTATATTRELRMDSEELEDLRWVSREQLRNPQGFWTPGSYSLASKLLRSFIER